MSSSLHMQVAAFQIQDDIRYASNARLAKQASQPVATTTGARRGRWVALRRVLLPSVRRAH